MDISISVQYITHMYVVASVALIRAYVNANRKTTTTKALIGRISDTLDELTRPTEPTSVPGLLKGRIDGRQLIQMQE